MTNIGSTIHVPTVSPVTFIPKFEKLGIKLTLPSWLSDLELVDAFDLPLQIMYPRIFDNDAHRATLPGLPASHYSVLYSSDHSDTVGYIGRADFDDIEGAWTDFGEFIHSGTNQRETPHPVYDPINNRVNVYVHDDTSTPADSAQAARLLTTTDLETLVDQGEIMPYGHHTGYPFAWYDSGFKIAHVLVGGTSVGPNAYSTSADGETFTLVQVLSKLNNHVVGSGLLIGGVPSYFDWQNNRYQLGMLKNASSGELQQMIAVEVDPTTFRPIGTHWFSLFAPGNSSATDYRIQDHNQVTRIGDTLYCIYAARDSSGVAAIHLAKSTLQPAPKTEFVYPVMADGELYRAATPTTQLDWNAVTNDLPATVIKHLASGVDTSVHDPGVGYELSGTGPPDLWLYGDDAYDPTDFETLEFVIAGLRYTGAGNGELRLGFNAGTTSIADDAVYSEWAATTRGSGSLVLMQAGVSRNWDGSTLALFDTAALCRTWTRSHGFTFGVRLSDFGKRVSFLVDGFTVTSRDIDAHGMVWTNDVRPFLRYNAGADLFLTRWTVKTFN